jgi:hypothetical protein
MSEFAITRYGVTSPQSSSVETLSSVLLLAAVIAGSSCSSAKSPASASCSQSGGAVAGSTDAHCGSIVRPVVASICDMDMDATMNMSEDAGTDSAEYGDTMYNNEGDDDDCKYHLTWSSTSICEDSNITFNLTIVAKDGGKAVTGAQPEVETFLNATHPGGDSGQTFRDTSLGNYSIGPVQFDTPGQWTVRFHLFPNSCDNLNSPHGHAAFFVDVP